MKADDSRVQAAGAAGAALLSLSIYGYSFCPDPNVTQVLPFILRRLDPALFPGDPYAATAAAFPSAYPALLAALAAFFPLEGLHLALYLAVKLAFFLALAKLARTMFRDGRVALVACVLAAASPLAGVLTPLGQDPLLKTSLYHTSAAAPLLLFALERFLAEKYLPAFALLAAAAWLSVLPAAHLAALFAAATCLLPRKRPAAKGWILFAALMLAWAWCYPPLGRSSGGRETLDILRAWHPGHYFPSAWPVERWLRIATVIPLLAWCARRSWPHCAVRRDAGPMLAILPVLWGAAWLFGEALSSAGLVTAQLFRSDAFFMVFGLVCAARCLVSWAEEGDWGALAKAALLGAALVELDAPFYAPFTLALLLASDYPGGARLAAGAGLLWCLRSALTAPLGLWRTLAAASAYGVLLVIGGGREPLRAGPSRALALVLILVLLPFWPIALYRLRTGELSVLTPRERDWNDLQAWARSHASPGERFFIPPGTQGFRCLSRRSPVAEWTDAAAVHWSPGYGEEWRRRIEDSRLAQEAGPDLPALAARYGADYLAREAGPALPYPVVYGNTSYAVYRIRPPQAGQRKGTAAGRTEKSAGKVPTASPSMLR